MQGLDHGASFCIFSLALLSALQSTELVYYVSIFLHSLC